MADILLTHSYFLHFDPKQLRAGTPYPPLATLFAAAFLRQQEFSLHVHDTMFAPNALHMEDIIKQQQPKLFVIYDDGFNYLTKMCLTNMRDAAFEMIALAKKHGCMVAISSSDSTDHTEDYLKRGADFVLIGEGEHTLGELAHSLLRNEENYERINGLAFLKNNQVVKTPKRENLRELDVLPNPAWDMIDATPYREMWLAHKGYFSLNMATTRGCPFKCNWCAKPIYGNRYNSRSPKRVVEELMLLQQKFGVNHIWFSDDIFGLKPGWVKEFSALVKEYNVKVAYKIQSRVDLLLEENYIKHLADSGCDEVWVGAESGSQKILDAMDKGTTVQQIEAATRLMKAHGIKPCFFLQFGYPGEHKEDIDKTVAMVKNLMPHDIGISVSYPLPGTVFYNNVKEQLSTKQNWTDSDELLVMFRGTYSANYYKQLQRLVHYKFRYWQALSRWSIKSIWQVPMRALQIMNAQLQLNRYAKS
jgi:radical SAM superfamily enzyme YgiQ (UPF0313 family)